MRATEATAAAVQYRRLGWNPIPIKERSKEPNLIQLAPYLSRRATRDELKAWEWPGVGVVTGPLSGVLVLDVDGEEGLAILEERGHPATPTARTGGGGLHLYFKHPETNIRTGIRVAPGLDVKAEGGYVVAPPSVGPTGKAYEWIISPAEADLAEPPDWLLELLRRPHKNGAAPPVREKIPAGQRNQELTSAAGTMRRRGMEELEIRAALEVMNKRRCDPPLKAEEVEKIARSVARYEPSDNGAMLKVGDSPVTGEDEPSFNLTDLGNAARLVHRHGENLRYCWLWAKWLVWDGERWIKDDTGEVFRLAKETVASIYQEAAAAPDEERRKALAKHAMRSEAGARIKEMVELARSDVPVMPDELDASADLLNTRSGTVDLRTGELREHRREDLITRIAPVEYRSDAAAPAWEAFLERVLPGGELRSFVQRAVGYSATGDTSEQAMFINHGGGANGKSTFQEAITTALGNYAMRAPTEMLLARRAGGVPNDVARLKGARFVAASETEEGRRLAESLIKDLTGQDTITARFMRAEFFDFKPTHKLWLSTNHRPEIRGTDNAIWRRIRLIPWSVTIPPAEQDKKLPATLRHELPGILAWIVQGCLEWRRRGLQAPDEVRKATGEYRAEMDVLAGFLAECCELGADHWDYARDLYANYRHWCDENGERPEAQRKFGSRLGERGCQRDRGGSRGAGIWRGLRLTEEAKARTEGMLTLKKSGVSSTSEPTDPEIRFDARKSWLA
jgi:putative DNA primase/helicase